MPREDLPSVSETVPVTIPMTTPSAAPLHMAPVKRRGRRGPLGTVDAVPVLAAILAGALLLIVVASAAVLIVRMLLFGSSAGAAFLSTFPGTSELPDWVPVGQPAWVQWQHWLNAFFIVLIIKTGWMVRTQRKPSAMWQPRSGRGTKISIEVFVHVFLDILWLANGVVFWILLFATGQWARVVPVSWDVFPNALSAALQYLSLSWPAEDGWTNYNALQVLAYFVTIFLAAPLAAVSGLRMSPFWPTRAARLSRVYPVETARRIHFPVMLYFLLFIAVHLILVLATGALRNLNHMFWGSDESGSWAGFWMFLLGIAAIVGGVLALRPFVIQQLGAVFGKVGR